MRAWRAPQAGPAPGAKAGRDSYSRFPHYPQAESVWCDSFFMTAFLSWQRRSAGNGREPSQPRPERGALASHQTEGPSEGGAADEAAARRKLRTCPLAEAKAAGFVKRPPGTGRLRAEGTGQADRTSFGMDGLPGGKRDLRIYAPPPARREASAERIVGQDRAWSRELRNRREPRASAHGSPGGTSGFGQGSRRLRHQGFGGGDGKAGSGTRVPNPPSGEPPGLRP